MKVSLEENFVFSPIRVITQFHKLIHSRRTSALMQKKNQEIKSYGTNWFTLKTPEQTVVEHE